MSRAHALSFTLLMMICLLPAETMAGPSRPASVFVHVVDEGMGGTDLHRMESLARTIEARLTRSGRFAPADRGAVALRLQALMASPDLDCGRGTACVAQAARELGVGYLMVAGVSRSGPTWRLHVRFYALGDYEHPQIFTETGSGGGMWRALNDPIDDAVERLEDWIARDRELRWRTPPIRTHATWLRTQFAFSPFGRGVADRGDGRVRFKDFSILGLNIGFAHSLEYLAMGVDFWMLPLFSTEPLVFDDANQTDRFQFDINARVELAISHAHLTGNFHLTELAYYAGLEGGYSTVSRPLIDGGLDFDPGFNAAVDLGLMGMFSPGLGIRGGVRGQLYSISPPQGDLDGFRVLITLGPVLTLF